MSLTAFDPTPLLYIFCDKRSVKAGFNRIFSQQKKEPCGSFFCWIRLRIRGQVPEAANELISRLIS